MQAEITAHVKLDAKCTITAKVSDDVSKDRSEKVAEMQTAVNELLKVYAPMSGEVLTHETKYLNDSKEKKISDKQIGLIKFLLNQQHQNMKSFCQKHSITSLQELSMEDARFAIQDLKTSDIFDEE